MKSFALEPIVTAPGLQRGLATAWDGRSFWALVFDPGVFAPPKSAGLWRSDDDGRTWTSVCSGADIFPEANNQFTARLLALGPGTLQLLSDSSPPGMSGKSFFARFDGTRFAGLPAPPCLFGNESESLVEADPIRQAVVLIDAGTRAIHEFAANEWRKIGELDPHGGSMRSVEACVAWDAARKALCILQTKDDPSFSVCHLWDGKTLTRGPSPSIKRTYGFGRRLQIRGAPHPTSGRALFIGSGAWRLGEDAFEEAPGEDFPAISLGGDLTAGPGTLELWGASLSSEPSERQRVSFDGTAWKRRGAPIPDWRGEVDRSSVHSIYQGTLSRLDAGGRFWETIHSAKTGDPDRFEPSLVWDAANSRLVMSGGRQPPFGTTKAARDAWVWTAADGWSALAGKGKPIARRHALGVFSRGELILAGGDKIGARRTEYLHVTEHFDGTRWSAFDEVFEGEPAPEHFVSVLADEKSGAAWAVSVEKSQASLWVYRGSGVWARDGVATVAGNADLGAVVFDFDPKKRRLVARGTLRDPAGSDGIFAAPLGEWLDAIPPRTATGVKKGSKAAKEKRAEDAIAKLKKLVE